MDRDEEILRGAEAQRLLENRLLIEAFEKVESGIVSAMQRSAMGDEKTHNRLVISLQLLAQVKRSLEDVASTGKMAAMQMRDDPLTRARQAIGI